MILKQHYCISGTGSMLSILWDTLIELLPKANIFILIRNDNDNEEIVSSMIQTFTKSHLKSKHHHDAKK